MRKLNCTALLLPCLCAFVLGLTVGCPPEKPRDTKGELVGWVADVDGNMLPLVKVSTDDGDETYTDGHGLFSFDDVKEGTVISFALTGYVPTSKVVDKVTDEITSLEVTLKQLEDGSALPSAATGGAAADAAGNKLTIPANALADASGKGLNGNVNVHITAIALGNVGDLGAAPGSFQGEVNGENVMLEAYAMANFCVMGGGQQLRLQAQAQAEVRIRLVSGCGLVAGDHVPLWHFDAEAGVWVQVGTATVQASGSVLVAVGQVNVFGWFCCAVTIPEGHHISGHVYGQDGKTMAGAIVRAIGVDYCGVSLAVSDDDGAYSLDVKPNAQVRVEFIPAGGYYIADSDSLMAGAAGETTTHDLRVNFDSCIHGFVTKEDGTPIKNERVYSSTGGSTVTNASGYYCLPAPGDTLVAVYVIGRPPKVVETPDAATCAAGDCAEANLSLDYPEDGDRIGYIIGTMTTIDHIFTEDEKLLSSTGLFYSGFEGEQFDAFEFDTTQDTYDVYTASIQPQFNLNLYVGLATNSGMAFDLLFNLDFSLNALFQEPDDEDPVGDLAPGGMKLGALDPGSPGLLTNGTTSVDMVSPLDYFYHFMGDGSLNDLGYACLEPWMGGFFFQEGLASAEFMNGDAVTYSWPGGVDLGAFSVSGVIPDALEITKPTSLRNVFDKVDGNLADLQLEWDTTGNPGDVITLLLETIVVDWTGKKIAFGSAHCTFVDDGAATIPASVLGQLPYLSDAEKQLQVKTQVTYLFARRHGVTTADVPLMRGDGDGYVVLLTNSDPVLACSIDAQISIKENQAN